MIDHHLQNSLRHTGTMGGQFYTPNAETVLKGDKCMSYFSQHPILIKLNIFKDKIPYRHGTHHRHFPADLYPGVFPIDQKGGKLIL